MGRPNQPIFIGMIRFKLAQVCRLTAALALLSIAAPAPVRATEDPCLNLFSSIAPSGARTAERYAHATEILNKQLADKYTGVIHTIAADPDAFVADIEKRFAAQKLLTPQTPYKFDYSDVGLPLLRDMDGQLTTKIGQLTKIRAEALAKNPGKDVSELDTALSYLGDLQKETKGYLSKGKVNYDDLFMVSSYFSRAYGHFDSRSMDWIEKL